MIIQKKLRRFFVRTAAILNGVVFAIYGLNVNAESVCADAGGGRPTVLFQTVRNIAKLSKKGILLKRSLYSNVPLSIGFGGGEHFVIDSRADLFEGRTFYNPSSLSPEFHARLDNEDKRTIWYRWEVVKGGKVMAKLGLGDLTKFQFTTECLRVAFGRDADFEPKTAILFPESFPGIVGESRPAFDESMEYRFESDKFRSFVSVKISKHLYLDSINIFQEQK